MTLPHVFPRKRPDGTCSVSARFAMTSRDLVEIVERTTRECLAAEPRMEEDLQRAPTVALLPNEIVEVVFEARAGSRYLRDWLVAITVALLEVPGLSFECFYDRVAERPHPASIRSRPPT